MFEKEAKERAEEIEAKQTLGVYDNDEDFARDEGWNDGYVSGYEDGFKDGAEFGYNKAKEWHYVKDGDLPKDKETVLALCIVGGKPYPYFAQYWKDNTKREKDGVDLNWICWRNNLHSNFFRRKRGTRNQSSFFRGICL